MKRQQFGTYVYLILWTSSGGMNIIAIAENRATAA
jgi:hypothetical protein